MTVGVQMQTESYEDFVARGGPTRQLDSDYYQRGKRQTERKVIRTKGRDGMQKDVGVFHPQRHQGRMVGERVNTSAYRCRGFHVPG